MRPRKVVAVVKLARIGLGFSANAAAKQCVAPSQNAEFRDMIS